MVCLHTRMDPYAMHHQATPPVCPPDRCMDHHSSSVAGGCPYGPLQCQPTFHQYHEVPRPLQHPQTQYPPPPQYPQPHFLPVHYPGLQPQHYYPHPHHPHPGHTLPCHDQHIPLNNWSRPLPPPQYPLPLPYPMHLAAGSIPPSWTTSPERRSVSPARILRGRRHFRLRKRATKSTSPRRRKKTRRRIFKPKPTPPPEPTLAACPLSSGGVTGPLAVTQSKAGWKSVLHDEHRRTFVAHRKGAFPATLLRSWWEALDTQIKWRRPTTDDLILPRSAAWLTLEGCTCQYEYSGLLFEPLQMPPWFLDITETVCRTCGLGDRPNSCNANYYDNGSQSVGWHSDDEPLFDALNRDVLIVSLSLGATRTFELASTDKPTEVIKLPLEDGDLCTMEGLCQKHYRHRVPRQKSVQGARINLTWRWVLRHDEGCRRRQQSG